MYKVQALMSSGRTVHETAVARNFDATKASAKRSSSYSNVLPSRSSWNDQENNGNQSGSRAIQAKGSPGGRRAPSPPRAATRRCHPVSLPEGASLATTARSPGSLWNPLECIRNSCTFSLGDPQTKNHVSRSTFAIPRLLVVPKCVVYHYNW